ncbi:murein hydrolase activator EnvC family protein [Microbacterium thalassium]|uniref:Murein DD-endopeptidase MepM/ murein hydrolase activator NlpD n=1 Tax=Microbacterium thalassium TaxID=362649 RepID=A0A7X0KVD3_9MICO|nr:M23 family metallopeptidase [Microbacterium thalassium]MBB6392117.1 murein DD-endopeptidase MepM/ murein hydrolase activator NlpD [Microbacterium thalassium]GLK24924.1 hypothetical protein GCM10017607_22420 [Microbacterium thalassium]
MNDSRTPAHAVRRSVAALVLALLLGLLVPAAAAHPATPALPGDVVSEAIAGGWTWPVGAFRLERAYSAPAHPYGSGHRGVDVRPVGIQRVLSPADGVVAFSGLVADRPVVTIDHGAGLVTTLEPVACDLRPGAVVRRGEVLGSLATGGHAEPGTLHIGVRLHGDYLNPMALLGGVPRAVLLPCC